MNKVKFVSINNEIVPEEQAKIGISDLSVQRGYGIFDFFKVINNRPVFMEDHLNRFFRSAAAMYLDGDIDRAALKQAIHDLMEKNDMPDSAIKIILTGGYADDGYTMCKPNLLITQTYFKMADNTDAKGLRLITYNHQRQLPGIKTIDYLQAIRLKPFVAEYHADDVLYHHNGLVTECPRANIFIVTEDEIITPKDNILQGITRSKVLTLAIDGYTVTERNIALTDLVHVKEAFITSSTKNALAVISVDGKQIGDGKPGRITSLINEKITELMLDKVYS